jgi:hypothetical protein
MSTRKARRVMSKVGMVRIRRARRKRGECPGAWKCAATAREKQIKTSNAAIGCTIRIEDRLVRVVEGNEKSSALSPVKRPSKGNDQYTRGDVPIDSDSFLTKYATLPCLPVVYPIWGPSHLSPLHQPKTPKS